MCWPLFTEVLARATGLHYTYPKDKQRAQEVKEKLLAEHDVEAHDAHPQPLQVSWVLCNTMSTCTKWPGSRVATPAKTPNIVQFCVHIWKLDAKLVDGYV